MQSSAARIAEALEAAGIDVVTEDTPALGDVLRVPQSQIADAVRAAKEVEPKFDFLIDMFGIDTGEAVDVVYHLRSIESMEQVVIKSAHEYGSSIVSVWDAYPATLTCERECAEMFGLTLVGHPNPKRLLTVEGIEPPLLKSTEIRTYEEARDR